MSTAVIYSARRNQNLYRQPTKLRLGTNSATLVVIAIISLLALLYLNQVTKTGVLGYQLNDLSTQRTQITTQKRDLSVEAARLQSIQTIRNSQTASRMVPVAQVSYASANN
jgi:hypothetical protein